MAITVEDIDIAADRELVERWQSGEHAAFDDLYRRHYPRLRSYCQRRVGDRDTAEEIAQEAFVRAYQALPRLAGDRRFYPWVTVIASRLCIDHHRRLGRVRPSDDVDPGVVDGDHGERLAFLADVDNLDRALRRLGVRHLEVLDLRERRGMTYAEIAEHLDVPQTTVEALLFRARKALRREFLAVSGEGRLASLPVIGIALRRLLSLRDRVAESLPSIAQLTGPVAAGAVAVIMANPFAPTGDVTVGTTAGAAPTPVSVARPAIDEPPPPTAPTTAPRPAVGHGPPAPSPAPVPGVDTMTSDEARERAADMPVSVDLGGVGLGVDPADVVGWLDDEEDR